MSKNKIDNSLYSLDNAYMDNYFSGMEIDVRETLDKCYVLNHDFITYNGYIIKKARYKKLKKDLLELNYVLERYSQKILLIEIKDYFTNIHILHNILNKFKNIYVTSFYTKPIIELSKLKRNYKVGLLNYGLNNITDYQGLDFICLHSSFINKKILLSFQQNNIEIFIYGLLNEKKVISKKIKLYKNCFLIVDKKVLKF